VGGRYIANWGRNINGMPSWGNVAKVTDRGTRRDQGWGGALGGWHADTEWTSARKMVDYYMDQSEGIEAARKRLLLGSHQGREKARSNIARLSELVKKRSQDEHGTRTKQSPK
jgi:hypothetical protein